MRKRFCLCENKGADQLCSNCTTDQHVCFSDAESTILFLLKILNFKPSFIDVQAGLCRTWSETLKTSFLALWLITEPDKTIINMK